MSQSARKIRRESFTVALLLGYRKSLEKRWGGGGVSRFYVENFFFSPFRNIPYGNPLLLHYFRVPKTFGEEVGGCQDFTSKNYCLTVPKKFVWKSFTVNLTEGTETIWRRKGGYQDFTSKNF